MSETPKEVSQRVLDEIQSGFPLVHAPYAVLAERLGLSRGQVREAVASLRADGIVRRIGASFSSRHLGYSSTLCALAASGDEAEVDRIANMVSAHAEVTHNYLRKAAFNIWFTLIAPSEEAIARVVDEIRTETGCEVLNLPATEIYKIKVDFGEAYGRGAESGNGANRPNYTAFVDSADARGLAFRDGADDACGSALANSAVDVRSSFDPDKAFDFALLRAVQGDIGAGEFPFADLGLAEDQVLCRLREWKEDGTIRRFGAFVRHQKMGFAFNGMSVWDVPAEDCARVGRILAGFDFVSHCYERPRSAAWPYSLYAMVHAKTEEELEARVDALKEACGFDCKVLLSLREYKKTSPVYFA